MGTEKLRAARLSKISTLHYVKLIYRSLLLLTATAIYVSDRLTRELVTGFKGKSIVLIFIWLSFAVEMVLRFFPSELESMGCQKKFAANYIPAETGATPDMHAASRSTLLVAASWIALNGGIAALYYTGVIDKWILLLISLAYSVCDMICILFFCPFQSWIMKNKCCGSCRIYNWDYAMMFTPLLLIRSAYTLSLFALGLALLIEWEIIYVKYPERFYEETNASLSCSHCQEKLCGHKKQLHRLWDRQRELLLRQAEQAAQHEKNSP